LNSHWYVFVTERCVPKQTGKKAHSLPHDITNLLHHHHHDHDDYYYQLLLITTTTTTLECLPVKWWKIARLWQPRLWTFSMGVQNRSRDCWWDNFLFFTYVAEFIFLLFSFDL